MTTAHAAASHTLPAAYYQRLRKWCDVVAKRLQQNPNLSLKDIEALPGWYHFPYTVLPAAVLYAVPHAGNAGYRNPAYLALALQIGDLIVREDARGTFAPRLDSYRDVSLWIEAYALLEPFLGAARMQTWRACIERNVALLVPELEAWENVPRYTENFLGSSPNHFAWWAATTLAAGERLGKQEWTHLGSRVLRRFATTEQNPDGYWGEHNPNAPTGGYNYLTTLGVGLYYEYTKSSDALVALRRAASFHLHTTYPDGNLIELFNDRNRYWHVSYWGTFAFTHFPEGRSYAELLMRNLADDEIDLDASGLIALNALYYHEGPQQPCPPEQPAYVYRLHAEAGVRKQGPWICGMSGIVDTPLPHSQWFLDRQANLSLFHEKTGPIIFGAHSKRQPELATFAEKVAGEWTSTPKGSRLVQNDKADTLALAYNSFQATIEVAKKTEHEMGIEVRISGRGPSPEEAWLGLQLNLRAGDKLETAAGKSIQLGAERIEWNSHDLGGWIRHNGWELQLHGAVEMRWPVFPYNPYRNAPENKLEHAVGLLRFPLNLTYDPKEWLHIDERRIRIGVRVLD